MVHKHLQITFILPFLVALQTQTLPCSSAHESDEPKPGSVIKIEIADKVFMEFCYIPPGDTKLGSTDEERLSVTESIKKYSKQLIKNAGWLDLETNQKRGTYKSKGFWLGKYEVTQGEWRAVMGNNPSHHGSLQKAAAPGITVDRLPVERIKWVDCQEFLEKLNKRPQLALAFGNSSKCVLPCEDEWEYAYRGGKGNERPYYWGHELNGTQANCNGEFPFETDKQGQYFRSTCEVDETNHGKYEVHPWGLCHMSGNVWEWCENKDSDGNYVQCGGSWVDPAWYCRAVSRWRGMRVTPDIASITFGLRVCVRSK